MASKRKLGLWFRVSVGFFNDPKILNSGPLAAHLLLRMIAYSVDAMTDGFVPTNKLAQLETWDDTTNAEQCIIKVQGRRGKRPCNTALCERMVHYGLLEKCTGGYQIVRFAKWQETTEAIESKRKSSSERVRKHRSKATDVTRDNDVSNTDVTRDSDVTKRVTPALQKWPDTDTDTDTEEGGSNTDQQYDESLPWETPPPSVPVRENAQHADEAQAEIDPDNLPEKIETVAQIERLVTTWRYGTVMRSKDISHAHKLVSRRPLTRREVLVAKERTDEADGPRKIALFLTILEGEMSRSRRQRESKAIQRQPTASETRVNAPTAEDEARSKENTRPITEEERKRNQARLEELISQL